MLSRSIRAILFSLFIAPLLLLSNNDIHADTIQDPRAVAVWARVVEANRIWFEVQKREVTFELETFAGRSNTRDKHSRYWFCGPDKARIEREWGEGNGRQTDTQIFNQGYRAWINNSGSHYQVSPVPFGMGMGFMLKPDFVSAMMNPPASLILEGPQVLNDRDVLLLKATNCRLNLGFQHDSQYNEQSIPYAEILYTVDAHHYTFVRVEGKFAEQPGNQEIVSMVWNIPEPYIPTAEGLAPRFIDLNVSTVQGPFRASYRFQFIHGNHWFGQDLTMQMSMEQMSRSDRIINPVFGPNDPSLFDIRAAGVKIEEATEGVGMITGQVMDLDSKQPIGGASVKLYLDPSKFLEPLQGETVSAHDGTFRFEQLPNQKYCIVAGKEGWKGVQQNLERQFESVVDIDLQSFQNVEIKESASQFNIELQLAKPRTVRGKVVRSGTEEPVGGAQVTAMNGGSNRYWLNQQNHSTTSNEDGSFTIGDLSALSYRFTARKLGFYPGPDTTYLTEQVQVEVNLQETSSMDDLVLQLYPNGILEGRVLTPQGEAIEGAVVSARFQAGKESISDVQGRYRLEGLPTVELDSRAEAYLIANASGYLGVEVQSGPISGDEPKQLDITLDTGGRIAGTVYAGSTEILAGLKIQLNPDLYRANNEKDMNLRMRGLFPEALNPKSDEEGAYRSGLLIPASYSVSAATDGFEPYLQTVEVKNDEETRLDIYLKPVAPISGIVYSVTNAPVEGADIHLFDATVRTHIQDEPATLWDESLGQAVASIRSGTDGKFAFTKVRNGLYTLMLYSPIRYGYSRQVVKMPSIGSGQQNIAIRLQPDRRNANMQLHVIDGETGQPVTDYRVWLRNRGGNEELVNMRQYMGAGLHVQNASGVAMLENITTSTPHEFIVYTEGYAIRILGPLAFQPEENKSVRLALMREGVLTGQLDVSGIEEEQRRFYMRIRPVVNADVKAESYYTEPVELHLNYQISPQGRIHVPKLPSGVYDFMFSSERETIASATMVCVTAGETIDLGVLPKFQYLANEERAKTIRFVKEDGGEWANLPVVSPWIPGKGREAAVTDGEGNVRFGYWSLRTQGLLLLAIGKQPLTLLSYPLMESPGTPHPQSIPDTIVYTEPKGTATLRGTFASQNTAENLMPVRLISETGTEPMLVFSDTTNIVGRFMFNHIPAGAYNLLLGGSDTSANVLPFRWYRVEIGEGAQMNVVIPQRGVTLTGKVLDRFGQPVAGADVQLKAPLPDGSIFQHHIGWGPRSSVKTDEQGIFTFNHVQAASYELWATRYTVGISPVQGLTVGEEDVTGVEIVIP